VPELDSALTTWELCQEELVADEDDEDAITALIAPASAWLSSACGRKFSTQAYTVIRDGNGQARLWLMDGAPITAITSVHEHADGTFDADSLLTSGTHYRYVAGDRVPGYLVRMGDNWEQGFGNIQTVYTAVYAADAIPGDVQRATTELVAYMRMVQNSAAYAVTGDSIAGGGSQAFVSRKLPEHVRALAAPYAWRGLW